MVINFSPIIGAVVGVVIGLILNEFIFREFYKVSLSAEEKETIPKIKNTIRSGIIVLGIIMSIIMFLLAPVKQSSMNDAISDQAAVNSNAAMQEQIVHDRDVPSDPIAELTKTVRESNEEFDEFVKHQKEQTTEQK